MPIKLPGRYESGPHEDRAHRTLADSEIAVDHVWSVEEVQPGLNAVTFTAGGKALTAFTADDPVIRVRDGCDVLAPTGDLWRSQY